MFARLIPRSHAAGTRLASTAVKTRAPKAAKRVVAAELKPEAKLPTKAETPLAAPVQEKGNAILKSKTLGARRASTGPPTEPQPKIPGNPELPVPPSMSFMDVKIPRPSNVDEETPVQIPFLPDFWDSSTVFPDPEPESTLPKLVVVGGETTHHGGGPSHNLLDLNASSGQVEPITSTTKAERTDSFLDDVTEDLGLPPVKEMQKSFWRLFS